MLNFYIVSIYRSLGISGGSRKKYLGGGWPLIIWEATMAKRNYYRPN